MDNEGITELVEYAVVIGGTALAYGKAFGGAQSYAVEAIIEALDLKSRFRPAVNIITGILIAMAFSLAVAIKLDQWAMLLAGGLAGFLASVEAAKQHDQAAAANEVPPPDTAAARDVRPWQ